MTAAYPPYRRLQPIPLQDIELEDSFWQPRRRLLQEVTLPAQFDHIEKTGRLSNFYRAAQLRGHPAFARQPGQAEARFSGLFFNDSDVYKWLEAAVWVAFKQPEARLAEQIETTIAAIQAAQDEDGYLNTYFAQDRRSERWTNLRDMHELYCAGHLFQAASAHFQTSRDTALLNVARRLADHIDHIFGPAGPTGLGGRPGVPGHPEIELALVELGRVTGESRYIKLAQSFLDQRGQGLIGGSPYHQDHKPFRQMDQLVGHAVRALYLCSGAADLYQHSGEAELLATLERLWQRLVCRQLYVSGGIGSRYEGESFGEDYELPNARAYTETCAAIASVMWNSRMLNITTKAAYADQLEWALYNAVLPGLSLDGLSYYYVNPLADEGHHRRQPWFECACCPPNIARTLATLPTLFYSTSSDLETDQSEVWVHLYGQNRARLQLKNGAILHCHQETNYPWQGAVKLTIEAIQSGRGNLEQAEFNLHLRIPGWLEENQPAQVWVNGAEAHAILQPGAYVRVQHPLKRPWQTGDQVSLVLPIQPRCLESHPYILENQGHVALQRGPLLYCLESADQPGVDLRQVVLQPETIAEGPVLQDLPGNLLSLTIAGSVDGCAADWGDSLYRAYKGQKLNSSPAERFTAAPYFAWGNRAPGQMCVWLRNEAERSRSLA